MDREIFLSTVGTPILYSDRFIPFKNKLSEHFNLLWFETSGSSGDPKVIGLSKEGFLKAAESVNSAINIEISDKWLIALPTFHVGGASIIARSIVGGFSTHFHQGKWNPRECLDEIEREKVTIISLVPTQLFDLVKTRINPPASLKKVVLGGGQISPSILNASTELGYRVIETYGMTETSALAAIKNEEVFNLLPHLEVKESEKGELKFKGESVIQKIGIIKNNNLEISDPRVNGWYTSSDIGNVIDKYHFKFIGRKNRVVKILGELVSLEHIENQIQILFPKNSIVVVDVESERRGRELILIVEASEQSKTLDQINQNLSGLEKVAQVRLIDRFPLLASGKIDLEKIRGMALG